MRLGKQTGGYQWDFWHHQLGQAERVVAEGQRWELAQATACAENAVCPGIPLAFNGNDVHFHQSFIDLPERSYPISSRHGWIMGI